MKSFSVSATIAASPEAVWSLLTRSATWPRWNPTVERIDGEIALGNRITVHTRGIGNGGAFPLQVAELQAPRRMVWRSAMPLGLFQGQRTYTLTPTEDGGVEFRMDEAFTGVLAPLITRSIPDLQPSFEQFAAGLKAAAELAGTAQ